MFDSERSKLIFPAGRSIGFNQNHVASGGTRLFSACPIGAGGGYVNVINGQKPLAIGGTPGKFVHSILGPMVKYADATDRTEFSGTSKLSQTITMAAILFFDHFNAITVTKFLNDDSSSTGVCLIMYKPAATELLHFQNKGIGQFDTTHQFVVNQPYFVAASVNLSAGGGTCRSVMRNLATGKLLSSSVSTSTGVAGVTDGKFTIGNDTAADTVGGVNMGPVMFSTKLCSLQELIMWSADPWSFWYPEAA